MKERTELATFGGGCFWCLEAIFQRLNGVTSVQSGYAGGTTPAPTYEQVCGGDTGHAEVVQVSFDPGKLPYQDLLEVFFKTHDPTTLNRQGGDEGTQYRSVIFTHTPDQKRIAGEILKKLDEAKIWPDPIVTEITPFDKFYVAEKYHQNYFNTNPQQPYCRAVVGPKVEKFKKVFGGKLKKD